MVTLFRVHKDLMVSFVKVNYQLNFPKSTIWSPILNSLLKPRDIIKTSSQSVGHKEVESNLNLVSLYSIP